MKLTYSAKKPGREIQLDVIISNGLTKELTV